MDEINDFFVERHHIVDSETDKAIYVIHVLIRNRSVETFPRNYLPNNLSQIRIPSALNVCRVYGKSEKDIIKKYRKQVGSHLVVNQRNYLSYFYTNLDENKDYILSELYYINAVYPCFVKSGEETELCLGLRFSENKESFRSFSRIKDNRSGLGRVSDLTEQFLIPKHLKQEIMDFESNKKSSKTFLENNDIYAIYMCVGSKLIVEDQGFNEDSDQKKSKNISLFQCGSVIIFRAKLMVQISFLTARKESSQKQEVCISFDEALNSRLIRPEDGLYSQWFSERGLDKTRGRVVFIGHNFSVHNSICWRLQINGETKTAVLSGPDGARIVDIQSWKWGLIEIYWRHCFERLYEKVLSETKTGIYRQSHELNYYIPTVSGKNPFYWERKIIGVGNNFNSWRIALKYKYKDQISGNVPPYYEQYIDLAETVPPFAPPLHPPIYFERHFIYLPYNTCPEYLDKQFVKIKGQLFTIKYKEGVDEYEWTSPQRISVYKNHKFSTNERLGVDLMVYKRTKSVVAKKIMFYFEFYSNDSETVSKETQKLWFTQNMI